MTHTDKLLALAEAATPGPWMVITQEHKHYHGGTHKERFIATEWIDGQLHDHYPIVCGSYGIPEIKGGAAIHMVSINESNAQLIAALNPVTVKEMLLLIRQMAEALGACDSASYVHNFYCVGLDEALAAYEDWEKK